MRTTNRQPEIVVRNGKPVSVILPIKEYEELLERAEDAEDVAWLKRARRKKLTTGRLKTIWPNGGANKHVSRIDRPGHRLNFLTILMRAKYCQ